MYKVTFKIKHSVIQYEPTMFDSFIAGLYLNAKYPMEYVQKPAYLQSEIYDFASDPDFPIEFDKEVGVFKASCIFLEKPQKEFVVIERKKWNEANHWRIRGKALKPIDTISGEYKAASVVRTAHLCNTATAFFEGNVDAVSELLGNAFAVGKKAAKGYGWIDLMEITEADFSFYDKLLRPLPMLFASKKSFTGSVSNTRLVPPYHQNTGAVPCICPEPFL
jgi:CRISPR type IV-associated protein Csf3